MMDFSRRGVMLVIASPSGAGKSSISRQLFANDPNIRLSVSITTRTRRTDEIDGTHYHFIDVPTFEKMRDGGELLEWAEVHGNYYATPREKVEERLSAGKDILFDIDYQGTLQLYENCRDDMVTVFILPPSIAAPRIAKAPSKSGCATRARRWSTIRNTITCWSTKTSSNRCRWSAPSSPAPASSAAARQSSKALSMS